MVRNGSGALSANFCGKYFPQKIAESTFRKSTFRKNNFPQKQRARAFNVHRARSNKTSFFARRPALLFLFFRDLPGPSRLSIFQAESYEGLNFYFSEISVQKLVNVHLTTPQFTSFYKGTSIFCPPTLNFGETWDLGVQKLRHPILIMTSSNSLLTYSNITLEYVLTVRCTRRYVIVQLYCTWFCRYRTVPYRSCINKTMGAAVPCGSFRVVVVHGRKSRQSRRAVMWLKRTTALVCYLFYNVRSPAKTVRKVSACNNNNELRRSSAYKAAQTIDWRRYNATKSDRHQSTSLVLSRSIVHGWEV